jgi:hypothetical protein
VWLNLNNLNFEFQKMTTSNKILRYQMIRTQKVIKITVVVFITSYNFYFGYFFIRQSVSTHCSQIDISLIYFHKLCERFMNLWIMCTTTLSDKEMTNIKVVDLDELYNFYIHHFFNWNHLVYQNLVWSCHFSKFIIRIVQTKSHEKTTKIIAPRT